MKFRKKPVVIDAWQYDGDRAGMPDWAILASMGRVGTRSLFIKTREGTMEARPGDWIIRGVAGEVYPCKPEIFDATYEALDE